MMDILIKKAVIIDSTSPFTVQKKDILITSGRISSIEDEINPALADEIIEMEGLHVSPGWFDTACKFGEPAYEEAETLESGAAAAQAGGAINFCPNCGQKLDGAKFCPNCGRPTGN